MALAIALRVVFARIGKVCMFAFLRLLFMDEEGSSPSRGRKPLGPTIERRRRRRTSLIRGVNFEAVAARMNLVLPDIDETSIQEQRQLGWPTAIPIPAEAELIAEVRREID